MAIRQICAAALSYLGLERLHRNISSLSIFCNISLQFGMQMEALQLDMLINSYWNLSKEIKNRALLLIVHTFGGPCTVPYDKNGNFQLNLTGSP